MAQKGEDTTYVKQFLVSSCLFCFVKKLKLHFTLLNLREYLSVFVKCIGLMVFWWKFASKGDRFLRKLIENRWFRFSLLCSLDFCTLKPSVWQMKFRVRIWIVYTFSWGNQFIITHSRSLPGFESMLWALKAKKGSKWNKHSVEKWEFYS